MLAIEIDGSSHEHGYAYKEDIMRQRGLEKLGVKILRFGDAEVEKNLEGVVATIEGWVREHTPSRHVRDTPLKEGN